MNTKHVSIWYHIFDVVLNIVIIVAIVAVIRTFLVSPFQVEGNSMVDTLQNGEYIIINKLVYFLRTPERGEIVVFRPPNADHAKHYVKRIIGLPGDVVVVRNGEVFLKPKGKDTEEKVPEEYLNSRNRGHTYIGNGGTEEARFEVPADHYFVMGDNREGSLDSRAFKDAQGNPTPFVPTNDIDGKVWFVALPIRNIHVLALPQYGF